MEMFSCNNTREIMLVTVFSCGTVRKIRNTKSYLKELELNENVVKYAKHDSINCLLRLSGKILDLQQRLFRNPGFVSKKPRLPWDPG